MENSYENREEFITECVQEYIDNCHNYNDDHMPFYVKCYGNRNSEKVIKFFKPTQDKETYSDRKLKGTLDTFIKKDVARTEVGIFDKSEVFSNATKPHIVKIYCPSDTIDTTEELDEEMEKMSASNHRGVSPQQQIYFLQEKIRNNKEAYELDCSRYTREIGELKEKLAKYENATESLSGLESSKDKLEREVERLEDKVESLKSTWGKVGSVLLPMLSNGVPALQGILNGGLGSTPQPAQGLEDDFVDDENDFEQE